LINFIRLNARITWLKCFNAGCHGTKEITTKVSSSWDKAPVFLIETLSDM
jgi:hypothetical protein